MIVELIFYWAPYLFCMASSLTLLMLFVWGTASSLKHLFPLHQLPITLYWVVVQFHCCLPPWNISVLFWYCWFFLKLWNHPIKNPVKSEYMYMYMYCVHTCIYIYTYTYTCTHFSLPLCKKHWELKNCLAFLTQMIQFNTYNTKWKMMGESRENKLIILLQNGSRQDYLLLF